MIIHVKGEITSIIVDKSLNAPIPFINRELKLLYLVAKNEKYIKMYDYNRDKLNEIYNYNSNCDSSYSVLFNRKCIDNKLEIDRFLRYNSINKKLYYI